jgi:amphi-Trp domain-containing protein
MNLNQFTTNEEGMEFKHQSIQDRESIVKYLSALREGFSDGRLVFSTDSRQHVLEPRGLLKFEVKSKGKDDEQKVTIKISWRTGGKHRTPKIEAFSISTDPGSEG